MATEEQISKVIGLVEAIKVEFGLLPNQDLNDPRCRRIIQSLWQHEPMVQVLSLAAAPTDLKELQKWWSEQCGEEDEDEFGRGKNGVAPDSFDEKSSC